MKTRAVLVAAVMNKIAESSHLRILTKMNSRSDSK